MPATAGSESRLHLLVIDDDTLQRMIVRKVAAEHEFEATGAASYEEAADLLGHSDYDCVVLDLHLGGRSGLDVLELFKEVRCNAPILLMSGADEDVRQMAQEVGMKAQLNMITPMPKPVNLRVLGDTLARIRQAERPREKITFAGWTADSVRYIYA